jgi:hypothetical protein
MDLLLFLGLGLGLGLLYFGSLWGSVRTLRGDHPRPALALSFAVRLTALGVTTGVLIVAGARTAGLLMYLLGIWLARGGLMLWCLDSGGHSHGT